MALEDFHVLGAPVSAVEGGKEALDLAFADRSAVALPSVVRQDVPELGVKAANPVSFEHRPAKRGCGCGVGGQRSMGAGAALLVAALVLLRRRRTCAR